MAFLESLAQGLRTAGGVLSPDVYQNSMVAERQRDAIMENRRTMAAQQIIRGVEDGAIAPEAGREALTRLGLPNVPVGLSLAGQARQEEVARRREAFEQQKLLRADIEQLTPEERSNPAALGGVFLKHGKEEVGARMITEATVRQENREKHIRELEQRSESDRLRSEDKALDRAQREAADLRHRQTDLRIAEMRAESARDARLLRAAVGGAGGKAPSGYRYKPDGSLEAIPGGPGDKSDERKDKAVDAIRKEFNALPEVKNYRSVVPILQSIKNAKDTPGGDLDFIYAVGKILDPDSVVREGELQLVIKSGSPLERYKGEINKVMGKGRLTPKTREILTDMLSSRVAEIKRGYDAAETTYRTSAERRQLPVDEIFMDFGATGLPAPLAPGAKPKVPPPPPPPGARVDP